MLQDKADSAWIFVTTSNQNKVGSNGLLEGIDSLSNNKVRYRWKTNYMIDYYLISVAIARYVEYTIYAHPSGLPNDSVMVMNYVYNNVNTLPSVKTKLDTVALVLEYCQPLWFISFSCREIWQCNGTFQWWYGTSNHDISRIFK